MSRPAQATRADGIAQTVMTLGNVVGTYETEATCLECTGISGGFGVAAAGGGTVTGKKQRLSDSAAGSRAKSHKGEKGQGAVNHGVNQCQAWIALQGDPPEKSPPTENPPLLACWGPTQTELRNDSLFLAGRSDLVGRDRACAWTKTGYLDVNPSVRTPPHSCFVTATPLEAGRTSVLTVTASHTGGAVCSASRPIRAVDAVAGEISISAPLGGAAAEFGSRVNVHVPIVAATVPPSLLRDIAAAGLLEVSAVLVSPTGEETAYGVVGEATSVTGAKLARGLCIPCPMAMPPDGTKLLVRVRLCNRTASERRTTMLNLRCNDSRERCGP